MKKIPDLKEMFNIERSDFLNIFFENLLSFELFYLIKFEELKKPLKQLQSEAKAFTEIMKTIPIKEVVKQSLQKSRSEDEAQTISEIFELFSSQLISFMPKKITFEDLRNIENRSYLLFLFSEFENYIFKCIKYKIKEYPEIISDLSVDLKTVLKKSKEIINDELILKGDSKNSLLVEQIIDELSDKKIRNLAFEKYSEVFKFVEKIGINHHIPKNKIEKIEDYRYIRNLFAHSDGTINQIFLNQVKGLQMKITNQDIGKKFELSRKLLDEIRDLIILTCIEFDNAFFK